MSKEPYEVDPDWEPLPDSRPEPLVAILYVLLSAGGVMLGCGLLSALFGP
ncbi:hypothetical protein [Posidoniimonas polymericola]|nr:hypothetical protein [Posidoniimonas polymericola]